MRDARFVIAFVQVRSAVRSTRASARAARREFCSP